ncbi:Triosephosphate isomerase [Venturia nashicola]|uniref:Triosephosphate isomerase n=1 Tax=Venturia nashicola TaxID=86259 RepID=A0A4Z1NSJ6_9PEZI|nr:Triosephosphate isomerase [Venturia nashicola]
MSTAQSIKHMWQSGQLITTRTGNDTAFTLGSYTNPFDVDHQALADLKPIATLPSDEEIYSVRFLACEESNGLDKRHSPKKESSQRQSIPQAHANLESTDAFLCYGEELHSSVEVLASEGPNELDRPHSSRTASSLHQRIPLPRPSITRYHSVPSALQSRISQSHNNPFVMDHQDLDKHDPTIHHWSQSIELSPMKKFPKEPEIETPTEESTNKTASSPQGFISRVTYLLWSPKNTEIPVRCTYERLQEDLQNAILKLQNLRAQEKDASLRILNCVRCSRAGLTSAGLACHLLRMQIREAERLVEDFRGRLRVEWEVLQGRESECAINRTKE